MSLPQQPVIKKFFTNKIESSRNNWYEYLIKIARIFYSLDGQEYNRKTVEDTFRELSPRSNLADRDASNFRDEFGAYGSFLGIYHLEKIDDKWFICVSEAAKHFLCTDNSNAAAFLRAQLSLFQYPNGMGAVISESGSVSVQGNAKTDTVRELSNNIHLNPFRLICMTVVALAEVNNLPINQIVLPYPVLLCMFNDDRLNQTYCPDRKTIVDVYNEYADSSFSLPDDYKAVLTNFKRNFHIIEKTGLFVRDSQFGLMVAQSNYQIAYDCIKTISTITNYYSSFDNLYGNVKEETVRNIIANNDWGKYYDAETLDDSILIALGMEIDSAPIDLYVKQNKSPICFDTAYKTHFSRNRIIFGAPGTGKSYMLNNEAVQLVRTEKDGYIERVTFHPDYSYANFVGTYKPVMLDNTADYSDDDVRSVVSVLCDKNKTAQEKYDQLYDSFKNDGLTRLPILLGLYTDESFKTKKKDGSPTGDDNVVERNYGKAIRKYVLPLDKKRGDISYEFVPGPFMRVYVEALKYAKAGHSKPALLIIEEINRANVAAVFGDVFQLLDRGSDNVSEYPIQASEDIKKYLANELGGSPEDYSSIKLPDNMFIWATMNSADQGVFPLDTAFKRRWDFTYLGIDDNDEDIRGKYVVVGSKTPQRIEWNELRKAINEFLANEKINEDKQLGPYFIARNIIVPEDGDEIDSKRFCDVFKNKVLMYLFDDAAKQKRSRLFEGSEKGQNRYSKICEAFDEQGIAIFHRDIQSNVKVQDLNANEDNHDENDMVNSED